MFAQLRFGLLWRRGDARRRTPRLCRARAAPPAAGRQPKNAAAQWQPREPCGGERYNASPRREQLYASDGSIVSNTAHITPGLAALLGRRGGGGAVYEICARSESRLSVSATGADPAHEPGRPVLDLRQAEEYAAGHISGARHFDAEQILRAADTLKKYKEKPADRLLTTAARSRPRRAPARTARASPRFSRCAADWPPGARKICRWRAAESRMDGAAPQIVMYLQFVVPVLRSGRAALLESKGVELRGDRRRGGARAQREEMITRSGRSTVPQIFIGERHVGGCDELLRARCRRRPGSVIEWHGSFLESHATNRKVAPWHEQPPAVAGTAAPPGRWRCRTCI